MTNLNYFNKLVALSKNAYVPYSNFKVAAIIKDDKTEYCGINVENFSYPATICAERSAFVQAMSSGNFKKGTLIKLFLYSDSDKIIYPCGVCLQVMTELINPRSTIIIFNKLKQEKILTLDELLPYSEKISFSMK